MGSAGVEHEASREVKPAAKQQRPEAAVAGPPDVAADPSHQPAPQVSQQGKLYYHCRVAVRQSKRCLGYVADISPCKYIRLSIQV